MRQVVVSTRLADSEEVRVQVAASIRGKSRAAYLRDAVLSAANEDLEQVRKEGRGRDHDQD